MAFLPTIQLFHTALTYLLCSHTYNKRRHSARHLSVRGSQRWTWNTWCIAGVRAEIIINKICDYVFKLVYIIIYIIYMARRRIRSRKKFFSPFFFFFEKFACYAWRVAILTYTRSEPAERAASPWMLAARPHRQSKAKCEYQRNDSFLFLGDLSMVWRVINEWNAVDLLRSHLRNS